MANFPPLSLECFAENLAKIKFSRRASKRQRRRKLFAAAEAYFRKLFALNEIIIKRGHERDCVCLLVGIHAQPVDTNSLQMKRSTYKTNFTRCYQIEDDAKFSSTSSVIVSARWHTMKKVPSKSVLSAWVLWLYYSYQKQEPFVRKRNTKRWQEGVTCLSLWRKRKQTQVDDAKRDKNATALTHIQQLQMERHPAAVRCRNGLVIDGIAAVAHRDEEKLDYL